MAAFVWDASALLALINQEPGWEMLEERLSKGAVLGTVNLAEVATKLVDRGCDPSEVGDLLQPLSVELEALSSSQALGIAALRPATRQAGLSLGDRACLALGIELGLPVLTNDRDWLDLNLPVEVILGRPAVLER